MKCAFGPAGTTPQRILSATFEDLGSIKPSWNANQLIAWASWPLAKALFTSSNHQLPEPGGEILYSFFIQSSAATPASVFRKPSTLLLPSQSSPPCDQKISLKLQVMASYAAAKCMPVPNSPWSGRWKNSAMS